MSTEKVFFIFILKMKRQQAAYLLLLFASKLLSVFHGGRRDTRYGRPTGCGCLPKSHFACQWPHPFRNATVPWGGGGGIVMQNLCRVEAAAKKTGLDIVAHKVAQGGGGFARAHAMSKSEKSQNLGRSGRGGDTLRGPRGQGRMCFMLVPIHPWGPVPAPMLIPS